MLNRGNLQNRVKTFRDVPLCDDERRSLSELSCSWELPACVSRHGIKRKTAIRCIFLNSAELRDWRKIPVALHFTFACLNVGLTKRGSAVI